MNQTSTKRLFAALFALALGAAACGSTSTEDAVDAGAESTEAESSDGDGAMDDMDAMEDGDDHGGDHGDDAMDDMDGMDHGDDSHSHSHGEPTEVPESMTIPTVALTATPDPVSGHNLFIDLTDFEISPENASSPAVDGEGHLHLYVDGDRVGRVYNTELHLDGLEAGEHMVMIEVNANDHSAYAVDGEPIAAMTMITVEASDAAELDAAELDGAAPTVAVAATADPMSGWNVDVELSDFELSAENAGGEPAAGEGHLVAFLDGAPLGRFYGTDMHIPDLEPGEHELVIELRHNNTAPYAVDGEVVSASVSFTQEESESAMAMDDTAIDDADVVVNVSVVDGSVETNDDRVEVDEGSVVAIVIESDVEDEVHVHGYDLFGDVAPDNPAMIVMTADVPGVFEVEMEGSGVFLFELQVS